MTKSKQLTAVAFAAVATLALAVAGAAAAQAPPTLQERVAALKESLAKSQALLRQYEWVETRVLSLKGEEKNRTESRCYYGADGKVQKIVISAPPEKKVGGLKGKIIEKKKAELTEYMQNAMELIKSYVPPDPERIEAAKNAGKVALTPAGSSLRIDVRDYEKPGDILTFELDTVRNTLLGLKVATWLENAKDKVTMTTAFGTLDDGATYPAEITLLAPSQSLEVRTTNSGYRKVQ